jgi:hypothetical protein
VSEINQDEITITLKGDGAPWVVIHANSPERADELLDAMGGLQEKIITAAVSFRSAASHLAAAKSQRPAGNGGGQPQQSAPQGGTVAVAVPFTETALRDRVKQAGGKWDSQRKVWNVPAEAAEQFRQHWAA